MNAPHLFPTLGENLDLSDGTLGSKAASLCLLASRGFRVPPGFIVTATAMRELGGSLDAAVQESAGKIGSGPFAVRSSAAAEDLPDASYAGMYETFLNVAPAGLGDAIRRGFDSALDERVSAYNVSRKQSNSAEPVSSDMAMIVQQMVPAISAGVAFTANPLTGHRNETIVTAVRGLGESLVSGETTGEQWTITDGEAKCTRASDGVLTQQEALAVAELARSVEAQSGTPQDIEWAIDENQVLFLLQARPMTAVPEPVEWAAPGPGLWSRNFRLGEWLPEAMTPLFADWLLPALESGYLDGMRVDAHVTVPFRYATVNGWYYNATPIPSPALLWRVLVESRGRAPWFLFNALARVSHNPAAADRAVLRQLETSWREQLLPAHRMLVEASAREAETASMDRLMEIVDEICRSTGAYLWSLAIVGGSGWKMEGALAAFWRKHLAEPLEGTPHGTGGHQLLLRGLPGAEPTLPSHAVYTLDWYHPTAGETHLATGLGPIEARADPTKAMLVLDNRLDCEKACRNSLRDQPKLLAQFDKLLAVAQHYAVLREEQSRDLSLGWPVLRDCARRLGKELQRSGAISVVDDFYFLTLSEVLRPETDHGSRAQERRSTWDYERRLSAPITLGVPPRLIGDPIARAVTAARNTEDLPEDAIIGHPASIGRATGRVRIITGPDDFGSFLPGEVLVAKATAPAWTPLFARAAAVVTDGGTLAAHASLVAREYGIPAIVGTGDATKRLHTGQFVRVDGGTGTVLPIEPSEAP